MFPRLCRVIATATIASVWGGTSAARAQSPVSAGPSATDSAPHDIQMMDPYTVSAERLPAGDAEGVQSVERYSEEDVVDSGAFSVDEFFETLPEADDGEEQLVLIDGEPAYLDPSMLPLDMIAGIDVSLDGSMPEFGARASGRVINIRLKENHQGSELSSRARVAFAGGGQQTDGRISRAFARGKLRAFVALEYRRTGALFASERPFSRDQDHTPHGGRDLRLDWGYPAVVESLSGPLHGITDSAGNPTTVALVPEGSSGVSLAPEDFLAGDASLEAGARGQRRFNTASHRMLISPSTRRGGAVGATYVFHPQLNLSFSGSYSETRGERWSAPPVSEPSNDTMVPAEFNPFGQDVSVGLVHAEFGPTRQQSRSQRGEAGLRLNGRLGESWRWRVGVGHRADDSRDAALVLDEKRFAASLASPDPATRFNPFAAARADTVNARLYPELMLERRRFQSSERTRYDLSLNGEGLQLPGGPVEWSARGNYHTNRRERTSADSRDGITDEDVQQSTSYEFSSSANLPVFGRDNARPLLRRLEAEISGEYSADSDGGREREGEFSLMWSPFPMLALRAEMSEETESEPAFVEERPESLVGETLIDPRRNAEVITGVREFARDRIEPQPEKSTRRSFGFTVEPPFWRGLRLVTTYDARTRRAVFHDGFDAQDVINNEAAFPGRVIREPATPEDVALGRPGRIASVDVTPGNAGHAERRSVRFSVEYRTSSERWGGFRFSGQARRNLEARYEIQPGVAFIEDGGSRYNPPDWTFRGTLAWTRAAWNVTLRAEHTGAIAAVADLGEIDAFTTFDLNVGYRFRQPLWGEWGRGTSIALGLRNLFDQAPPFADTLNGYRGGSPLGRALQLTMTLPLR